MLEISLSVGYIIISMLVVISWALLSVATYLAFKSNKSETFPFVSVVLSFLSIIWILSHFVLVLRTM